MTKAKTYYLVYHYGRSTPFVFKSLATADSVAKYIRSHGIDDGLSSAYVNAHVRVKETTTDLPEWISELNKLCKSSAHEWGARH